MTREELAVLDAALRTDFLSFLRRCVATLNPGATFLPNWHLEAIAYQLDRVITGEINRLIINLPPRYLKSIMVSVAFPAYLLGLDPRRRIFGISYGGDLTVKHATDCRSIMESRWYRRIFPKTRLIRSTPRTFAISLENAEDIDRLASRLRRSGHPVELVARRF